MVKDFLLGDYIPLGVSSLVSFFSLNKVLSLCNSYGIFLLLLNKHILFIIDPFYKVIQIMYKWNNAVNVLLPSLLA